MPLAGKLGGPLEGTEFQPKEQNNGKTLAHARFKQLLTEIGISFLESNELGSPTGCAWTEAGSLDTYGHDQGAKLAWRVEEELSCLQQRITELLQAGWTKVVVGGLNLGGSIEPIYNAVSIIELAANKGAQTILMPVSSRKQLFELPDELATKVTVVYYADAKDALLKALSE